MIAALSSTMADWQKAWARQAREECSEEQGQTHGDLEEQNQVGVARSCGSEEALVPCVVQGHCLRAL